MDFFRKKQEDEVTEITEWPRETDNFVGNWSDAGFF